MKIKITLFICCILAGLALELKAQHVPVPAPPQSQPIVVRGATAHLGNGRVVENSLIAFEAGKFTVVDEASAKRQFPGHREIDASGMHLYPGFIAPNSTLGLVEVGQVRASRDDDELGTLNPNISSIIAYNTDSEVVPTVRSMGVLMAEVAPQGGRISGTSSIVQLDAWNWEDAVIARDFAMHLNWPSASSYNWRERRVSKNDKYDEEVMELEAYFKQARAYAQKEKSAGQNLRFEAMKGLFNGSMKLFIHANDVQSIQEAVLFAGKFDMTPVIVGGRDSWMITDFLLDHDVPVILRSTQSLPGREDADIDQPFKTPATLQEAGVRWCFQHEEYWQQRNLPFQAGQSLSYGLAYEDAIRALTSSTAAILGIGDKTGTIEPGKDATFFLCAGDVLDMRTSHVKQAFIQGREVSLDNKQEMLYRKFQQKYKD